jgi:hypothetical protein
MFNWRRHKHKIIFYKRHRFLNSKPSWLFAELNDATYPCAMTLLSWKEE